MKFYNFFFLLAIFMIVAVQVQSSPLPDVKEDVNDSFSNAMDTVKKDIQDLKPKWDSFVEDSKTFFENVGKKAQEIFDKSIPKTD